MKTKRRGTKRPKPKPKARPQRLSLQALSLGNLGKLLTRSGTKPVTSEQLQADVAAGAPTNPDGTLNLIHFSAWLLREVNT